MIAFALLFVSLSGPGNAVRLASGDDAFFRIDYDVARGLYESALTDDVNDPEVLWRLARLLVCMGEIMPPDEAEPLFRAAEEHARRCVELDSTSSPGYTWLAASLGYIALQSGIRDQVELSGELLAAVDAAIRLDPENDAAYSIRGSFYRALGNLGWVKRSAAKLFIGSIPNGGFEESEEALQHAISLAPDIMRHRYELGVLYMDMGRNKEARLSLEKASTSPVRVAIDIIRRKKTARLLEMLESK